MTDRIFRSGSGRARVVVWLFITGIVMQLVSIGSDISEIELLQRMRDGEFWTEAEAEANDLRVIVIAGLYTLVLLAGIIAFLVWLYRVRSNLPALGIQDARWSPGWAVGWWFVPIMSLFRPYQLVKEVWQASGPEARPVAWRYTQVPALLGWWWALFLIGSFAGNIAFRMTMRGPETIDGYISNTMAYTVSAVIWVVATIPAIMVVKGIDRRQAERQAALILEAVAEARAAPDQAPETQQG